MPSANNLHRLFLHCWNFNPLQGASLLLCSLPSLRTNFTLLSFKSHLTPYLSSLLHGTHKASIVSLQLERSCATFIPGQVHGLKFFLRWPSPSLSWPSRCLFPLVSRTNLLQQHSFPSAYVHQNALLFTDVSHFQVGYFLWPPHDLYNAEAPKDKNPQLFKAVFTLGARVLVSGHWHKLALRSDTA